jgi:hypothetical protein
MLSRDIRRKCTSGGGGLGWERITPRSPPPPPPWLISPFALLYCRHTFPCIQFQSLFHPHLGVLCIFRSRYLFAIGLRDIFSLRGSIPPVNTRIPTYATHRLEIHPVGHCASPYGAFTLSGGKFLITWTTHHTLPNPGLFTPQRRALFGERGFSAWTFRSSFATTNRIIVIFFSCR